MDNFDSHSNNNDIRQHQPEARRRSPLLSYFAAGLAGALIGSLIMAAIAPRIMYGRIQEINKSFNQPMAQQIVLNPAGDINIASAVAQKVMPVVVGITTRTVQRDAFGLSRAAEGVGSGVIVHPDGYILTNSHVVGENASRITVYFMGGVERNATVLWQEPILDLAVIKVDATGLTAAELGDSDAVIVGEPAIAIGNPLGLRYERTVTQGIISGLNRSIWVTETELMEDLIQTDAAINPGNSGGPLINSRGEIIGINTVKANTAEGLGFAIPINVTKPVIRKFANEGRFVPTYMGIMLLDSEFASMYYPDVELDRGILVTRVVQGGAADTAGLRERDIITHINDVEINTLIRFKGVMYDHDPGDRVTVRFLRNDKEQTTEVELVAKP